MSRRGSRKHPKRGKRTRLERLKERLKNVKTFTQTDKAIQEVASELVRNISK